MRTSFPIRIACAGFTVVAAAQAKADLNSEILADDPVAYWRMDDSLSPASDSSGNGRDATGTMATVTYDGPSLFLNDANAAMGFSGNGQLRTGAFEKMDGGGFTVEFWIKFNSEPTGFTNLVGDGEAGGDFMLMVYAGAGGFIRAHAHTTGGIVAADSTERIAFGGTHHVVSTWDAATGDLLLYLDGAEVARALSSGTAINSDNPILIGQDGREPRAPDAVIDEVAIYNYPLSPERIATHFNEAEVPDPPDPPKPPEPFAVEVGSSTLIGQLDYSDSFTIGETSPIAERQSYPAQVFPLPAGVDVVEGSHGNPPQNWGSTNWSIATDSAVNPGATGYAEGSGAGSDTGMTQRGGGGDWSIPYGLRDVFVLQSDFLQLDDRVDFTVGASPGNIFGAGNISLFFRRTGHPAFPEIGIYNGSLESDTGLSSGIPAARQWFNYALLVDVPNETIEVFVNEESRGVIDLTTIGGGAYAGVLNNAFVGIGGAGNDRLWSDNFQVGAPGGAAPLAITEILYNPTTGGLSITWNSRPGVDYTLSFAATLESWLEIDDGIPSGGESTTYSALVSDILPPGQNDAFFRVFETVE